MFLKSITIQGFKSFAKKVVIDLSSDVTGVVGPNGSGKSNVAEAIRFVLGEQSMKGLRSKSGSDLIFKGSAHLSALSRASVSITLNNQDKKINQKLISASSQMSDILINFINLDEIILTREIYADGQSEYTVNNTKVRLKDVQELLALAQISAAGHTIINQGEADKILLSNNKERREILEEALGLRIYHMRIKESEKKLSKVSDHLREIDLMRKENLPHLNFLKKQIEKLESREKEVENISTLLKIYLSREDEEINKLKSEINFEDFDFNLIEKYKNEIKLFEEKKKKNIISSPIIDNQEIEIQNPDYNLEEKNKIESLEKEILEIKNELNILNTEYENKYKESVNIDLEIKFLEKKSENKKLFIEENQLENFEMSQEKI
jgi:chromosome segregation protein